MENVGGVFLVLAAGAGVSFVICLMEFVITKINQHRRVRLYSTSVILL